VKFVAIDATVHAGSAYSDVNGAVLDASATLQSTTGTSTLRDTLGLPHTAAQNTSFPTGAGGIGAAIIDSGIQPNGDFTAVLRDSGISPGAGWRLRRMTITVTERTLRGWSAAAEGYPNYEYQGIAPDIKLIGLKVLDAHGAGNTSDVISAIEFVVANKAKLNVQIINLSLGHPIFSRPEDDPLVQAVDKASQAGASTSWSPPAITACAPTARPDMQASLRREMRIQRSP
jgi:serine protease AprX